VSLTVPQNRWIDVAPLVNWVSRDTKHVSLDDRMAQFGLQCIARHQASGDTFVTAELLLMLLPALRGSVSDAAGLARLARDASPPY
jgi:DNA polymerase-3 subunit epsilon